MCEQQSETRSKESQKRYRLVSRQEKNDMGTEKIIIKAGVKLELKERERKRHLTVSACRNDDLVHLVVLGPGSGSKQTAWVRARGPGPAGSMARKS